MMTWFDLLAQMGAAVLVLVALWILAAWAEAADNRALVVTARSADSLEQTQLRTVILTGYADGIALRNKVFDTIFRARKNYLELGGDGMGGASGGGSFSYSFWALVRDPNSIDADGMTILLKGDPRMYTTWQTVPADDPSNTAVVSTTDVLIKAPEIALLGNKDGTCDIVCRINTTASMDATMTVSGTVSPDPTVRSNIMSLIVGNWSLWTLSVRDRQDPDQANRMTGCEMLFYINDMLIKSQEFPNQAVVPNLGDLHLFPARVTPQDVARYPSDASLASLFVADMVFCIPALAQSAIKDRLTAGISNNVAVVGGSRQMDTSNRLVLGAMNVTNLANT